MKPEYELIRSNRKTLSLEITRDATVLVRAPRRCPQNEIDRFVTRQQNWISAGIARQRQRMENRPEPTAEEREVLIDRAKRLLPERVAHFAALMDLHPAGITITGAATRFGSCSAKNRLCFSWRLMRYPAQAIDYVVVHELAHIAHKNHGHDFYALIQSILPDYRERWQLLKD